MKTIRLVPQVNEAGDVHLKVSAVGFQDDEVGPLVDGQELVAILEDEPEPGNRHTAKTLRKRSTKAERVLAKQVGGKLQPGSGCLPKYKSDVLVKGKTRLEHKFTQAKSYTLKFYDLLKLLGECEDGEDPVFVVEFQERGTLKTLAKYAIVPFEDWEKAHDIDSDD